MIAGTFRLYCLWKKPVKLWAMTALSLPLSTSALIFSNSFLKNAGVKIDLKYQSTARDWESEQMPVDAGSKTYALAATFIYRLSTELSLLTSKVWVLQ